MHYVQLFGECELRTVESGEIILNRLRPADQLEASVLLEEHLGGAELAVVVVAHGETVSAGVVDAQDVPDFDFRQAALDGELVVVLAQAAGTSQALYGSVHADWF